jgi:energy-coupling factor transporter transmembrane protein EcfT
MTAASAHAFFQASASVAGALIGLLFVAISVAPERILGPKASDVHGVRAAATLTAFSNALTVVLFGLIPGFDAGGAAVVVAVIGLLFISAALLRVFTGWRAKQIQLVDVTFLVGLLAVFVVQLLAGVGLSRHHGDLGDLQVLCTLVVVCFLIGIERAWELVGGPRVRLSREVLARMQERHESQEANDAGDAP